LIKTFYPFPIAFPYRALSPLHNRDLLDGQFRATECLLAFVGSLALALNRPAPSELVKAFAECHNFSDGKWLGLGRKASKMLGSAAGRDLPDGLRLLFDGRFNKQAGELVELRNDYHHPIEFRVI
jgi:hypothetical protein